MNINTTVYEIGLELTAGNSTPHWILVTMPVLERMEIELAAAGRKVVSRVATPEAVAGHLVICTTHQGTLKWTTVREWQETMTTAEAARNTPQLAPPAGDTK